MRQPARRIAMVRSVSSATVSVVNPPALDGFGAPGAQRAGNHGNAVEQIEGALFQVLAGDVFERLPAGEPAVAIADFDVAGDGAHARIVKWRTSMRMASGAMEVSASMVTRISLCASRRARVSAADLPRLGW